MPSVTPGSVLNLRPLTTYVILPVVFAAKVAPVKIPKRTPTTSLTVIVSTVPGFTPLAVAVTLYFPVPVPIPSYTKGVAPSYINKSVPLLAKLIVLPVLSVGIA